jgi:hypothetical protein
MRLIANPYDTKKDIITFQATWNYVGIIEVIKDINRFLDDKSNYYINEMCDYLDLEELI